MTKPTLLILAAGIGSRYGSLKQLDQLGPQGETIIDYSVYDALRAGFGKVVFVIRKSIEEEFKSSLMQKLSRYIEVDYVLQEIENIPAGIKIHPERIKPWGTGHAVLMAKDAINEPFAVINADDFYGADAFRVLNTYLLNAGLGQYAMVGYELQNTLSEHGYVSRGVCETNAESLLTRVTERTKIARYPQGIMYEGENAEPKLLDSEAIVSMNCWGFTPDFFRHLEADFDTFIRENASKLKGEFYIPSVVNDLINSGEASVKVLRSGASWFGVTYREDREYAVSQLAALTDSGEYPDGLWK
jgi:UTP-glucose-1-phosphate uridylyltransferase